MLAELADKAASVFMQINDDQLRRRITILERELATTVAELASVRPRSSMPLRGLSRLTSDEDCREEDIPQAN